MINLNKYLNFEFDLHIAVIKSPQEKTRSFVIDKLAPRAFYADICPFSQPNHFTVDKMKSKYPV